MQVKDLANQTGVAAHVIRYYTQIGLLTPARDPKNRYRKYALSDISRVRLIRCAKRLGFTLRDVRSILKEADEEVSPSVDVRQLLRQRGRENRARLKEFSRQQSRIEEAIRAWDVLDDQPHGYDALCRLVESVESVESVAIDDD